MWMRALGSRVYRFLPFEAMVACSGLCWKVFGDQCFWLRDDYVSFIHLINIDMTASHNRDMETYNLKSRGSKISGSWLHIAQVVVGGLPSLFRDGQGLLSRKCFIVIHMMLGTKRVLPRFKFGEGMSTRQNRVGEVLMPPGQRPLACFAPMYVM